MATDEEKPPSISDVPSQLSTTAISDTGHSNFLVNKNSPGYQHFFEWMQCFCVVTFDLELGQSLEVQYSIVHCSYVPLVRWLIGWLIGGLENLAYFHCFLQVICPQFKLTEQDRTNICYLAFPDSNSGCLGDTQFHFRCHLDLAGASVDRKPSLINYNAHCAPSLQTDSGMCYGYVYFRQVKFLKR